MAGHSKWANIRFRKGAQDAKREKIFTKLIREITVATRQGGGDTDSNPRLRDAISKAMKANMKKDTIDNAINKGMGKSDSDNFYEINYEGYGPGGIAIVVECLTENKNRTVSEVRFTFAKHKGNLGETGSVGYLFEKVAQFLFDSSVDEEKLLEVATQMGGEDIETLHDGTILVSGPANKYHDMAHTFTKIGYSPKSSEVAMVASTYTKLSGKDGEKAIQLLGALEELDDVQHVYSNAEFSEDFLDK